VAFVWRRGRDSRRRRGPRFASASIDALAARDVEGLFRQTLAGEIANFTGVSDPDEAPEHPDIVVHTDRDSIPESLDSIWAAIATPVVPA
jgi:adenylylsulfate kinase-like enzyme